MSLKGLKIKKLMEPNFWENSHFGQKAQNILRNKVFWLLQKMKLIDVFFLHQKWCIIVFFMILQKQYLWETSGSSFMVENPLNQSDCSILW